jgi:hypothetical protein
MAKIRHRKVNLTGLKLFCHYTHGVTDTSLVSLDACHDNFYPVRPGADEVRLDLIGAYRNKVGAYPKNLGLFLRTEAAVPGSLERDLPKCGVRLFDAGHFSLEIHCDEIATAARQFFGATRRAPCKRIFNASLPESPTDARYRGRPSLSARGAKRAKCPTAGNPRSVAVRSPRLSAF